jgi:opacity protein-like surface antigen
MIPVPGVAALLLSLASPSPGQAARGWDGVAYGGWSRGELVGSNQPFDGSGSRDGFTVGLGLLFRMNDDLGWEFGARYTRKGADGEVDLTDYTSGSIDPNARVLGTGTTTLDYVEFPVTIAGYLPVRTGYLRGYLGLGIGVLTAATFEGTVDDAAVDVDLMDKLEEVDGTWIIGASYTYELARAHLWLDARYAGGARSIDKSAREYDVKTSTFEFALGLGVPLGGN